MLRSYFNRQKEVRRLLRTGKTEASARVIAERIGQRQDAARILQLTAQIAAARRLLVWWRTLSRVRTFPCMTSSIYDHI